MIILSVFRSYYTDKVLDMFIKFRFNLLQIVELIAMPGAILSPKARTLRKEKNMRILPEKEIDVKKGWSFFSSKDHLFS